ncbi:Uncharacterized protein SCF082_LOCUS35585 [Durusdinium trenchii]|uniref:NrS-1 polymerase-like helicase domain-containing protein n=1 Tax=Durusdinium trenchii TaxID=1381693 RepID=A0ABP0P8A1_9DINO
MPKVTQAIRRFLEKRAAQNSDLIERYLAHEMETQVNVSAGDGFAVDGKKNTYTDGMDEWWNIRIPKKANSEPEWRDYELTWPLDVHADDIGSTGWDWKERRSRWLGYDFDSITGHAAGVGVTQDELDKVCAAAQSIPWVEVRRSTSGSGLHLYVLCDVPTENHTVHQALGRAVLGMMSSEAGFDFSSQLDACGGNMWIWSTRMGNTGLSLIKAAEATITEDDLPTNWRAHLEVISRQRSKIRVEGVHNYDTFEALANSRRVVPLDDKHKAIIDELQRTGFTCVWVPDHHLLQTHTGAFAALMEENELGLVGFFKTVSSGKDPGEQNCFAFPIDDGGWKVYRFSPGTVEAETWEQDGDGWTTCYFNHQPSLRVAAKALGGLKDPDKNDYVFDDANKAIEAAEALGQKGINLDDDLRTREARLTTAKDGRIVMRVARSKEDEGENDSKMKSLGWLPKRDYWVREFNTRVEKEDSDSTTDFDQIVRALDTPDKRPAGWKCRKIRTGDWKWTTESTAMKSLAFLGKTKAEAESILGGANLDSWTIVNMPFQPEFPGNRQWNMDAPQYKYHPAEVDDDEAPKHPHWDKILTHCGQDLDAALRDAQWARDANIRTGRDYLLHWAACMLREPNQKLPYLFFFGDQNSGKSIFHEALSLLMTSGVAAADRALISEYNGELTGCVLAVIEERNLPTSAYTRLKDWITNPVLWIRRMRTDAYPIPNTTHWVQTANERTALLVQPGDTRITVIFVPMLEDEIPKPILIQRLQDEAPYFMRTVMDLKLPPMTGRLRLPVVESATKEMVSDYSRTPLEVFIDDCCHHVKGEMTLFSDFVDRFCEWLKEEAPEHYDRWHKKKQIISSMPYRFPYGKWHSNKRYIGNLSFTPGSDTTPVTVQGDRLKRN